MPTKKKRQSSASKQKKKTTPSKRDAESAALESKSILSDGEEDEDLLKNNEDSDERTIKKVKRDEEPSDDPIVQDEDGENDQQKSSDNEFEDDEEYLDDEEFDRDDIDWSNKEVVSKLDISVIQKEAKRRGLSIKGNRKAVMNRILDSFVEQSQVQESATENSDSTIAPVLLTPKKGVLKTPEQVFSNGYTPSKKSQGKRERAFEIDDPDSWTLAELRHYLKVVYNIRAYDNKQKILARYLDQIKKTLVLSRMSQEGAEVDISHLIVTPTKNSKQKTPKTPKTQTPKTSQVTKTPKTKEKAEPKKTPSRIVKSSKKEPVVEEKPTPDLGEIIDDLKSKELAEDSSITYEERGSPKERFMPIYAQPSIHKSFEMSYNRKRIQLETDPSNIDPYFSEITSSYNHITYEYPSPATEPHQIPVSDRVIKDDLLDKIVQEQIGMAESQDISQISSLEYISSKEEESTENAQPITTLYGLDKCKSLQKLTIQGSHLSSIYPISKLADLKEIYLSRNRITNLQYLPPHVEVVNLSFNLLKSLRMPTSVYNSIVYLNLSYNQIDVNIESLCHLNCLEELDISGNCLTDEMIQPLENANFKKLLKSLRLNDNYITDLTCIMDFNLIELSCGSNFIFDLSPLSSLRCLSEAFFDNNPPLLLSLHIFLQTVDLKSVTLDESLLEQFKSTGESNSRLISLLLKEAIKIVV